MRIVFVMTLAGCVFCCNPGQEQQTREIAIEDLHLNEVVHDSLSYEQLRSVERIHAVFSEVSDASLEETITNFRRDKHPDREIAVWLQMAEAYQEFVSSKELELEKKKEAYTLILLRSMMTKEEVIEKINLSYLSEIEVQSIFEHYNPTPQLLKVR